MHLKKTVKIVIMIKREEKKVLEKKVGIETAVMIMMMMAIMNIKEGKINLNLQIINLKLWMKNYCLNVKNR